MIERQKTTVLEKNVISPINYQLPHIVWGAIFAGVVMAIVIELVLALLGAGIGLSTINPSYENENFRALGIGAMIWWTISGLIGLYFGGWTAGRLSGIPYRTDGILHGLLTWGVATLLLFLLLTTTLGAFVGGGFSLLRAGGSAVAQMAPQVAPEISGTLRAIPQAVGLPAVGAIEDIRREARDLLQDRGGLIEAELMMAIGGLAIQDDENVQARRDDLVAILTTNAGLSMEEAESTVERWTQQLQSAGQEVQQSAANISERAENVAQNASDVGGKTALASFFMLALGGLAAAIGGAIGVPDWAEEMA